jgi:hypothetical protein
MFSDLFNDTKSCKKSLRAKSAPPRPQRSKDSRIRIQINSGRKLGGEKKLRMEKKAKIWFKLTGISSRSNQEHGRIRNTPASRSFDPESATFSPSSNLHHHHTILFGHRRIRVEDRWKRCEQASNITIKMLCRDCSRSCCYIFDPYPDDLRRWKIETDPVPIHMFSTIYSSDSYIKANISIVFF